MLSGTDKKSGNGTRSSAFFTNNGALLVKAAVVLISICSIYYQDLSVIFSNALEFTTGNITNYVLIVPILAAFIIYRKRNILKTVSAMKKDQENNRKIRSDDILGITLCAVAIIFYIAASDTLYALEYHILTLPLFLAGATMLLFNIATLRHSLVAILITLFLQPPPGQLVSELAADLSWTSAIVVEGLISLLGVPVSLDSSFGAPALIITGNDGLKTPFFVGEPSSGVFSTIGLSLFAIFVAYIVRGPIWKRTLLFLSGFPIFYLLNALRIAIIILLWHSAGPEVSEAYHVVSGSVMVAIGSLIILLGGEKILRLRIRNPKTRVEKCSLCDKCGQLQEQMCLFCGHLLGTIKHNFTQSTWERIAVLLFVSLVTVSATSSNYLPNDSVSKRVSDLDIATIQGPETADYFLPVIKGWDQKFAYRDTRIESVLNQDAALAYKYSPVTAANAENSADILTIPQIYVSLQISTGHHIWEDSLVSYPSRVGRPAATILESDNIAISDERQGKFLLFKRVGSESTEAVIYWFERIPLKFGSTFENRNVLVSIWTNTEALAKSGLIDGPADSSGIKQLYLSLALPIQSYWQEQSIHQSSGEILYSFFSDNLKLLLAAIILPAAIFLIHHELRRSSIARRLHRLYHQLVSEDKFFMDSLMPVINNTKPHTGDLIFRTYQRISGRQYFEQDQIMQKLRTAKSSGLVKNKIASINDEPLLIWQTSFRADRKRIAGLLGKVGMHRRPLIARKRHNVNNRNSKNE